MRDPVTKRGVLNDFDLARSRSPERKPSSKDNTGTLPFMALDLLDGGGFNGKVQRLYRHDAESFTWCLVYICICMGEDRNGEIHTIHPNPLSPWFVDPGNCLISKTSLVNQGFFDKIDLHQNLRPLVSAFYNCWVARFGKNISDQYEGQRVLSTSAGTGGKGKFSKRLPTEFLEYETAETTKSYQELPDQEWFKRVFLLLLKKCDTFLESKAEVFFNMIDLVTKLYPFVKPSRSKAGTSN